MEPHPFWNARLHLFEISPQVINLSPLLKRQWDVFQAASSREAQQVHGNWVGLAHGRFSSWALQHSRVHTNAEATHRLVMERGDMGKNNSVNLHLPHDDDTIPVLLARDQAERVMYPLFEVVPLVAGAEDKARWNFFLELRAPVGQEWDDTMFSDIMKAVAYAIRTAILTTSEHKLYVSSAILKRSTPRKHSSVLIHSNVVVHIGVVPLIEAHLIRRLHSSFTPRGAVDDLRWESSINPLREFEGCIVAPMLQTSITAQCPHCYNNGQLSTAEWCPSHCCHGYLQKPSCLQLRGVFSINGAKAAQALKQLLQSPTLSWRTLTIHPPAGAQLASLSSQIIVDTSAASYLTVARRSPLKRPHL